MCVFMISEFTSSLRHYHAVDFSASYCSSQIIIIVELEHEAGSCIHCWLHCRECKFDRMMHRKTSIVNASVEPCIDCRN